MTWLLSWASACAGRALDRRITAPTQRRLSELIVRGLHGDADADEGVNQPPDKSEPPQSNDQYVYCGGLTDRQREACHCVQDLLTAKNVRPPQKIDLRPYVEKLRLLSDALGLLLVLAA